MALVIAAWDAKHVALPADGMAALGLHAGPEVSAVVEGNVIGVSRLDKFLVLRGSLANNDSFEAAWPD